MDLLSIFMDLVKVAEAKNGKLKIIKSNHVNADSEFKIQSIKLLESIFSLRSLLEAIHIDFTSLVPLNNSSGDRYKKMEENANIMTNLCKDFLKNVSSPRFINLSLPTDIRAHRMAVVEMLKLNLKDCEDIANETLHVKRIKQSVKKKKHGIIDDSLQQTGSVNHCESDPTATELESLQINADGVYKRLNADIAEKEVIEKQLIEIGKMNQTLSENIFEQHNLISRMEETSFNSNLNIEFGNDQIKSAMQNQSSMRFWIVFIIFVLSFTLFFLDWYNP